MSSDTWKTGVSGVWGAGHNWTGGVPNATTTDVTIAVAGTYTVTLPAGKSYTAGNVTLDNETATLDLAGKLLAESSTIAAGLLDLTGSLIELGSTTLAAGTLDLAGTLIGSTSIELDGGTLALDGGLISFPTISLAGTDMVLHHDLAYDGSFLQSAGILDLNGFDATLSGVAQLGTGTYAVSGGDSVTFAMVTGAGTLDITNFAEVNGFSLSNGAVLQDDGIIVDTGYLYFGGYTNAGFYGSPTDSASMSIASGAVFDFIGSSIPFDYEQFPITYFAGPASSIVNARLFEMNGQGSNPILPFFTNASTGTIAAEAGADLRFTGGGLLAGKLTGAGEINFTGGTYTLEPGLIINAASFVITDDDFEIPVLLLNGSATLAGGAQLGEGEIPAGDGTDGTIAGPGVLVMTGTAHIDSLNLTGGAALEDRGTIILNGNLDLGDDSPMTNDTGTDAAFVSIAAGGIFDITAGGAIDNYDVINGDPEAASIVNTGLFKLTAGTSQSEVDGPFTNNGTVAVYTSTLLLTGINGDAAGTLTGGIWEAKSTHAAGATLALETPAAINTDDAQIILSRSGSELLSGPNEGTAIEQSLTSIAPGGVLSLLEARGFAEAATLTDAGTIVLQGG